MTDPATPSRALPVWIPLLLDLLVVTVFVLVGRRSHDEGNGIVDFLRVWWPFAAGLGIGGVGSGAWWYPYRWVRVTGMWVGTVVIGMLLRISIQGREFKPSFVVVTSLFLGLCFFGWRLAARAVGRRRLAT